MAVATAGGGAYEVLTAAGLDQGELDQAFAVLQAEGVSSKNDLREIWANAATGKWSKLAIPTATKEKIMTLFEKEMGIKYEVVQAPPKALATSMSGWAVGTRGGQMVGPWRQGY